MINTTTYSMNTQSPSLKDMVSEVVMQYSPEYGKAIKVDFNADNYIFLRYRKESDDRYIQVCTPGDEMGDFYAGRLMVDDVFAHSDEYGSFVKAMNAAVERMMRVMTILINQYERAFDCMETIDVKVCVPISGEYQVLKSTMTGTAGEIETYMSYIRAGTGDIKFLPQYETYVTNRLALAIMEHNNVMPKSMVATEIDTYEDFCRKHARRLKFLMPASKLLRAALEAIEVNNGGSND